jgi:hypothetical protein
MPTPPAPPPFMPGDPVTVTVLGMPTRAVVTAMHQDPRTLEWTRVHMAGPQGRGTYVRSPQEVTRGWLPEAQS